MFSRQGFSFIELIISVAIFAQITIMVGSLVFSSLEFNESNRANKNVNMELYSNITNGIGSYIRRGTGIMYEVDASKKVGTDIHSEGDKNNFDRQCEEEEKGNFDRLTIFQDKEKTDLISFTVEKDTVNKTSRLVYKKGNNSDESGYYLNSEDTYITCFLVSVSPNPYLADATKNIKDIQPYVQIFIAGKYKYDTDSPDSLNFFQKNTYLSYKTTFTLRNYIY